MKIMHPNVKTIATLLLALPLLVASCRKDRNTKTGDNDFAGSGVDIAMMDNHFADAQSIDDQAETGNLSTFRTANGNTPSQARTMAGGCATITVDTTVTPHLRTIDFGPVNCLGLDGKNRRGKILVHYNGHYKDSGSLRSITFSDYYVNDNQILGTKTVTNMGQNSAGEVYYNIMIDGSIVKANGAGTVSGQSSRVRTWLAGYNTAGWMDDEYAITGTASITRANGNVISANVTTPLHRSLSCNWIDAGVISITPQSGNVRTLDYGTGTCDDAATVTVNGNVYNITLH